MTKTCAAPTATVYLAENPHDTLSQANESILSTAAYRRADEADDWDETSRLEAEQDALEATYGEAWETAARAICAEDGIEIGWLYVGGDASQTHDVLRRNTDDGDLQRQVWQRAHDRVGVEVRADGTWRVWL